MRAFLREDPRPLPSAAQRREIRNGSESDELRSQGTRLVGEGGVRWAAILVGALAATALASPADAAPRRSAPKAQSAPKRAATVRAPKKPAPAKKKSKLTPREAAPTEAAPTEAAPTREGPPVAPSTVPAPPSAPGPAASAPAPLPPVTLGAAPASPDATIEAPPPALRRVTLTANPLALIVGRYGANVEVLLAPHHAVTASGFVQTFPTPILRTLAQGSGWNDATRPLFGGELGYRVYSRNEGAAGLFAGASFVLMPIAYPRLGAGMRPEIVSYHAHGGALDVGVQAILKGGITIGGGVGVMALAYPRPDNAELPPEIAAAAPPLPTLPAPRVLPRLLFAAGYSF